MGQGAAADLEHSDDLSESAIASSLAAEIYGLDVLRAEMEDHSYNTTRFIVLAREPQQPALSEALTITTFIFRVRNVPAALYKAMGPQL